MALASAVQNSRYVAQVIVWADEENDPLDLTGATLSGRILSEATGEVADIDGTLSIIDPDAGSFSWQYGPGDVSTPGRFQVQFTATYGSISERTFITPWYVERAI